MSGLNDHIPLEKLPLNDLLGFLEINPPRLPYKSLVGAPPFSLLNEFVLTSDVTGFQMSLGGMLAQKNYAHLLGVISAQSSGARADIKVQFNTDTAPGNTNYTWNRVGSSASSATTDGVVISDAASASTAPYQSPTFLVIPNFLQTSTGKAMISLSIWSGSVWITGGTWVGPGAVTQLDFSASPGIKTGSRFSFYALGSQ